MKDNFEYAEDFSGKKMIKVISVDNTIKLLSKKMKKQN